MLKFFDWSYRAGAKLADELQYVPMPKDVVKMIESAWAEVTDARGQPAWMEPLQPSIDAQLAQRRARPHIGGASWGDPAEEAVPFPVAVHRRFALCRYYRRPSIPGRRDGLVWRLNSRCRHARSRRDYADPAPLLLIQAPNLHCTSSATLLDFANVPAWRLLFLRRRR
jgi:hypothetical protein